VRPWNNTNTNNNNNARGKVIWRQAARCERVIIWGKGSRIGSAMALLDRALLSFYRLSIVTILLSVTVWPQFAMQF